MKTSQASMIQIFETNFREAMKKLPEEEKVKIQAQVEEFRTEQMKFDREVIIFL